jgi:integrase
VDFEHNRVVVPKSKSDAGENRWIGLPDALRPRLLAAWMRQGRPSSGPVLEVSVMSGKLAERARRAWGWDRDSTKEKWRNERKDALNPIGLHECRHTYASFLMASRYTLRELMEYLGHSSLQATERYVKLLPQPGEDNPS